MNFNAKIFSLIIEMLFWYLAPCLFLAFYISTNPKLIDATPAHLYLITLLAGFTILVKTACFRTWGHHKAVNLFFALVYTIVLTSMVCYYSVVITLLKAWGRVVTVEIVENYSHQIPALCELLGVSVLNAVFIFSVSIFFLIFCFYKLLNQFNFIIKVPDEPKALINILLLSVSLFLLVQLLKYFEEETTVREPVSLSFFSGKPQNAARTFSQNLKIPQEFNISERLEKQQYQINNNTNKKNVVLIVVDALRSDHMSVYGYQRATTPYLDRFKTLGNLSIATNVHASCGESVCGLSSMAASRYSFQMPEKPLSLTKVLMMNQYKVHMILGDVHQNTYTPEDIYGNVTSYYDGTTASSDGKPFCDDSFILEQTNKFAEWDKSPFMIQYHLMSAHLLGTKLSKFMLFQPSKNYAGKTSGAADAKYTNFYDNGVLQADAFIHQILDTLQSKQYLENTLVIITADHGESLGEHQLFSHTNSVYEQLLHVPLILIDFKNGKPAKGEVLTQFTSQIDIAPTILKALNIHSPSTWSGKPMSAEHALDFTFYLMMPYVGLYDHRDKNHLWKYWVNLNANKEYAYDLSTDPNEHNNQIESVSLDIKQSWRHQIKKIDLVY